MILKRWTWKQWAALSLVLLVLVISTTAYSVFVPKLRELEKAEERLQKAQADQEELLDVKVPKPIGAAEKKALALQVPVSLEQSRFLRVLRDAEQEAGIVIKSVSFPDEEAGSEPISSSAEKSKASVTGALVESKGKLSVYGDYAQVRKFFERFTQMERLVTFNKWSLSTEEVRDTTVSVTTRSVPVYAPPTPAQTAPPAPSKQTQPTAAPSREELLQAVDALNRPLLKDRTPLYTQQEYDRVVESVMAKLLSANTQRDQDLANLEIQQATNRYQAGQEGKKEAVSIVDQEQAGSYVPGANTNIRQVLGTTVSRPNLAQEPAPSASNSSNSPLYFLNIPTEIKPTHKLLHVIVRVDIEFTIYQAPGARGVLPKLDAFSEYKPSYDPTYRSNPVETR